MRCIEIAGIEQIPWHTSEINRNMRCIEMGLFPKQKKAGLRLIET